MMAYNVAEALRQVLDFKKPARMPAVEWCMWWDETIAGWEAEGMPAGLRSPEIYEYFGIDQNIQFWLDHYSPECPKPAHQAPGIIQNKADYGRIRGNVLKDNAVKNITGALKEAADSQSRGEAAVWYTVNGFFWFPRELFGVVNHLMSFYDHPLLYHRICEDLLQWQLDRISEINAHVHCAFMTIAEDMSYNNGPMISKNTFDEFILPYYKVLIPHIQKHGTKVFVDTDGNPRIMIPWLLEAGVDGIFPLERQAGVDVANLRQEYPELLMIGGFDKMCMLKGENAIRAEIERLRPVAQAGGYIPAMDHQTPPGTKMDAYRMYLKLIKEIL